MKMVFKKIVAEQITKKSGKWRKRTPISTGNGKEGI